MIYTVTCNPAIDYVMDVPQLVPGAVNRSAGETLYFGGKGINVSIVLAELGIPSRALGFVGGFTGEAIEQGIAAMGIGTDFVHLEQGSSRINVKLRSGAETEINGRGPEITPAALEQFLQKLDSLQSGDTLVLAGSIPGSLPKDLYSRILERLSGRGVRAVADAEGELLLKTLLYRPFLVKPNENELGAMFGVTLGSEDEIALYARKLQAMGAMNVLVSRAGDGSLLLDEFGRVHTFGVCKGTVRNSVGAGDSMIAGFLAGVMRGDAPDYDYALKLGTAAGGATAFSEGLAKRADIETLLKTL